MEISILIPARSEEKVLPRLLISLERQVTTVAYEILLGDDASEDGTLEVMESFAKRHSNTHVYSIPDEYYNLSGKTKALAFLARKAKGKVLLFTDADMQFRTGWVDAVQSHTHAFRGVTVFSTGVESQAMSAKLQNAEWLIVLCQCYFLFKIGVASTGLGNNMAISTEVYNALGGYEKLGFSIVEDYALYIHCAKSSYGVKHVLSKETHGSTLPAPSLKKQRTRWIKGALESKSIFLIPAFLQISLLPALIVSGFLWPFITLCFVLFHSLYNSCLLYYTAHKTQTKNHAPFGFLFTLFTYFTWPYYFILFLLNGNKIDWKGRAY